MCTRLSIKAKSGEVVVARTMDFAKPTGQDFGEWKAGCKVMGVEMKYSFKGKFKTVEDTFHIMCDGQNEAGLSLESLWLPETTFNNETIPPINGISGFFVAQFLLGQFATIKEVQDHLTGKVINLPSKYLDNMATTHMSFTDITGDTLVVEFKTVNDVDGTPVFYKNPIGLMTNAPTFPWHLENLRNSVQYHLDTVPDATILGMPVHKTGFGNNLAGLPADPTPPSRFTRTAVLASKALDHEQPKDADAAVLLLDKLMGYVNVIGGTSAAEKKIIGVPDGQRDFDYTQWTVYKDLKNYKLYQKSDTDWGIKELVCPVIRGKGQGE